MSLRGINRVIIAVRDLEKSKDFYSRVLGATFHEANWTGAPFGIDVAISWDAGIELIAPMAGRERDCVISPLLERRGEGVMNVVFGVDNGGQAKQRAEAAGVRATHSLDFSQAEIDAHLDGLFRKYEEHVLDSAGSCGFSMTLAQIDPK
jgi:catechol 2,3-dioxygenase-like lactoylglutathione lyase family enzyme